MRKDFTHLPEDSQQNLRQIELPEEETTPTRKLTLALILLLLLGITAYNYLTVQEEPDYYEKFQSEVQSSRKIELQNEKQKLNKIEDMYSKTEEEGIGCKVTLTDKAKQRVSYGQPRPLNSSMKAVVIEKKRAPSGESICAITNGINIITNKTITTARNFLEQKEVYKWIVFIGLIDEVGDKVIRDLQPLLTDMNVTRAGEVNIDSGYEFVTKYTKACSSVVYLQNTFVVEPERAQNVVMEIGKIKQQFASGFVAYTESVDQNGAKKLKDLRKVDLNQINEQRINDYIYMFDAKLLTLITPLNFVHFNKYTLQQLLIYPLLALTQKSPRLIPIKGKFHVFDEAVVQFKQFALTQVQAVSTCFVAYPTLPNAVNISQIKEYIKSVKQMNAQGRKMVLVIYIGYSFDHEGSLFDVYQELIQLQESNSNIKIRLRIQHKKAVSSIAVYESAHTYCPKSSLMVTSRFHVLLDKQFFPNFLGFSSEKYHFYYSGREGLKTASQLKEALRPQPSERFKIEQYVSSLSHMQIFETQFLRMVNLWVLKSDQDQFYQSEASFVLPLIEMAGDYILGINNLFQLSATRSLTETEQKQMIQLQKYSRWPKMQDNTLQPIPYNSLTNLDLRRGNLNQIPKIIHQVWFKDEEIPQNIQTLQNSIKEMNKGYEYKLWKKENLTSYDFPLSYALVARTLEYEWAYQKSFHAWVQALVSYEALYNHGGIYLDLNVQAKKPLDSFLRYELFFAGFESNADSNFLPISFGRQIIGAKRFSYHMRFILAELITEQSMNYDCVDLEAIVGGDVIRMSVTDNELFTTISFGFHLFNYDPFRENNSLCKSGQIPCSQYEQAYIVLHELP